MCAQEMITQEQRAMTHTYMHARPLCQGGIAENDVVWQNELLTFVPLNELGLVCISIRRHN